MCGSVVLLDTLIAVGVTPHNCDGEEETHLNMVVSVDHRVDALYLAS